MRAPEPDEAWVPSDTFGARLALLRQRMRWNTQTAAEECDLNPESWRQWERGRHPRDIHDVARKIAERTGCDYTWLMVGGTLRRNDDRPTLTLHKGGRSTTNTQPTLPFLCQVR